MKYIISFILLVLSCESFADDFRPASLTIQQLPNQHFDMTLKVPIKKNQAPKLEVVLNDDIKVIIPTRTRKLGAAYIQTWRIERLAGLGGLSIDIDGLTGSNYELILRIPALDGGSTITQVLNTERPSYIVPNDQTMATLEVFTSYIILGFEHILIGADHLLFVFALILIVSGWQKLVWTITFFTLAHSITLAAVTLDIFHLPSPPVEAVIALSIIFLAKEIITVQRGKPSLTAQSPWLVAFVFGLLHGMGFAGALSEIGVPENEMITALLSFNIGVELGQLTFVAGVLVVIFFCRHYLLKLPKWTQKIPAYCVGTLASFWLIERLMWF